MSWDDVGALSGIREELALSVIEPIRNPEKFKALGLTLHAGVLLYGPPGCGKTLLAKAVANESGANFISVKGPELLDKYVGESERAVRLVFERARASNPCVVFFDELDSLVPKRGMDSGGSGVSERVVNQLLTELDGLESRRSVFVIAATNRPELIDPAMMRPGRLDKLLYVPVPTPQDRVSILKALAKGLKLASDVDLDMIGLSDNAEGYSGADCAALLREAGLAAIKEDSSRLSSREDESGKQGEESLCIRSKHFVAAFKAVMPSVSARDQKRYDRIRERICSARSRATEENDGNNKDSTVSNTEELEFQDHPTAIPNAAEDTDGKKSTPLASVANQSEATTEQANFDSAVEVCQASAVMADVQKVGKVSASSSPDVMTDVAEVGQASASDSPNVTTDLADVGQAPASDSPEVMTDLANVGQASSSDSPNVMADVAEVASDSPRSNHV